MPDAFVKVRQGEKRPVYGQATAQTGTLTVSGTPTVTFYDSLGSAVAGLTNVNATGYDAGVQAAPRVWYLLDTTTPVALGAGFYTAVFKFSATGSDGLARTFEPAVEVQVADVRG